MFSSLKTAIRAYVAPDHQIACANGKWNGILKELDRRGGRHHEAGAFLLGQEQDGRRVIDSAVYYDDLDPKAYESGVCVLHANAFATLWQICRAQNKTVVADVHTHGGDARQSEADRTNPMVACEGHIAMIIPNFAVGRVPMSRISVLEYRGDHEWTDRSPGLRSKFFYVGFWS